MIPLAILAEEDDDREQGIMAKIRGEVWPSATAFLDVSSR
jgi:hypothetical protein